MWMHGECGLSLRSDSVFMREFDVEHVFCCFVIARTMLSIKRMDIQAGRQRQIKTAS